MPPQTKRSVNWVKIGRRNKRKGREREILVRNQLQEQGWCVVRATGSLGIFDLIALHPDINTCLLIQVKSNKMPEREERERIMAFLVPNYCQKLIWRIFDGKPKEPEIYVCGRTIAQVPYEYYLKEK